MKIENENVKKKSNWKSYWPLGIVVALVLIGWYLAAGSSLFDSQAAGPQAPVSRSATSTATGAPGPDGFSSATSPSRPIEAPAAWVTRNADPGAPEVATVTFSTVPKLPRPTASENDAIEKQFKLSTAFVAETIDSNKLDYRVNAPVGYGLEHIMYAPVTRASQCHDLKKGTVANLQSNVARDSRLYPGTAGGSGGRSAGDLWFVGRIDLTAYQADTYYCFRVLVGHDRHNGTVERHFMMRYPVSLWATDRTIAGDDGNPRKGAVISSIVYADYTTPLLEGKRRRVTRSAAQRQYIFGNLEVWGSNAGGTVSHPTYKVTVKGLPKSTPAHGEFDLYRINYAKVTSRAQCSDNLFSDESNYQPIYRPPTEFFLASLETNQSYCMQVELSNRHSATSTTYPIRTVLLSRTGTKRLAVKLSTPLLANSKGDNYTSATAERGVTGAQQPTATEREVFQQTRDHVLSQLQVAEAQTATGWHFKVYTPHNSYSGEPNPEYAVDYAVNRIDLGKVSRLQDCSFSNWRRIENKRLARTLRSHLDPRQRGVLRGIHGLDSDWRRVTVNTADRGSRYCIKVTLSVLLTQRDSDRHILYQPEFLFASWRGLGINPTYRVPVSR